MPNVLPLVKSSFYNLGTIDPVDIIVELPQKQKILSCKHRNILAFVFIYYFGDTSPFWSTSNWPCFSLSQVFLVQFKLVNLGCFCIFYINMHLTDIILYSLDLKDMCTFVDSSYFSLSKLHSFASLLLVETQTLMQ